MNIGFLAIALLLCYLLFMSAPIHAAEILTHSAKLERPKANMPTEQFELLRQQMVKYQLRDRGIKDERVLTAMSKVPRDRFVDPSWQDLA